MNYLIDKNKLSLAMARCGKDYSDLGIPPATIRNVQVGNAVRPKTVYKFAQALNCDVEDIIKREES